MCWIFCGTIFRWIKRDFKFGGHPLHCRHCAISPCFGCPIKGPSYVPTSFTQLEASPPYFFPFPQGSYSWDPWCNSRKQLCSHQTGSLEIRCVRIFQSINKTEDWLKCDKNNSYFTCVHMFTYSIVLNSL